MKPATKEARRLIHDGVLALSQVEANGMRIDVEYLDRMIEKVADKIKRLTRHLQGTKVYRRWELEYGENLNVDSSVQLGKILFDSFGYDCPVRTKTGRHSTSISTLEKIDIPFVRDYLKLRKFKKLQSTYLKGLRQEVCDGYLHPSFNLHLVKSFRSSSDSPNFQNLPIRDPIMGKVVRRAIVPRSDEHMLIEVDYSAIEVRAAAWYHKDPTMLKYIEEDYDLHRDMAAECFMLDEVPKRCRQAAKGLFVFASFYGDWYPHIAEGLWDAMADLTTADGVPLRKNVGYDSLGNEFGGYMSHVKKVYENFWGRRFPVYDKWRRHWWDKYCERGWMRSKTGFLFQGVYRRNEVINYPIQSVAFHCLLWSLIRLSKRLQGMRSKIVGQIHDSMLLDVHDDEREEVVGMLREVMCDELRRAWPWIITPLAIEIEGSRENWHEKKV